MKRRIPVIVLTGFLGSGKTTRLKRWLRDPALQEAVLIINELGEVGIDQQTLRGMTDQSNLLSNQCVCCTGLAGLEEVLTDLKWRILTKTQAEPPCVIIETTGIADPAPVLESLRQALSQDYQLQACLCCIAADTAPDILAADPVAARQIDAATQVLITKTDLSAQAAAALAAQLQTRWPHHRIIEDGSPGCAFGDLVKLDQAPPRPAPQAVAPPPTAAHAHTHANYGSRFETVEDGLSRAELVVRMHRLLAQHGHERTRIKGFVKLDDQRLYRVDHAPASRRIDIAAVEDGVDPPHGVTVITPEHPHHH